MHVVVLKSISNIFQFKVGTTHIHVFLQANQDF